MTSLQVVTKTHITLKTKMKGARHKTNMKTILLMMAAKSKRRPAKNN